MTPRVDPAERRKEILGAALRCFARKGFHRTTMDEIVAESGLSKGTLYWHFDNKKALFITLFDTILEELMAPLQDLLAASLPASERLRLLGEGMGQALSASQELTTLPIKFLMEAWLDEEVTQHYTALMAEFAAQVEDLLKEGIAGGEFREVDTHEVAWGLMALVDGIVLYHMTGMPGNVEKQLQIMTDLFVKGLRERS